LKTILLALVTLVAASACLRTPNPQNQVGSDEIVLGQPCLLAKFGIIARSTDDLLEAVKIAHAHDTAALNKMIDQGRVAFAPFALPVIPERSVGVGPGITQIRFPGFSYQVFAPNEFLHGDVQGYQAAHPNEIAPPNEVVSPFPTPGKKKHPHG
jgi:hypothetical protein